MNALQLSPRIEANWLLLNVEFKNQLDEAVYLPHWGRDYYGLLRDPALTANSSNPLTRALAYVCSGAPGEVVLLNGEGPRPPPGIRTLIQRHPSFSRVRPKQSCEWTIKLPLPLLEWSAYQRPQVAPTPPFTIMKLRYRIETLRQSSSRQHEYANFPGIFMASGRTHAHAATVLLPEPVSVLQRTDAFTRFG